jgi:hypothetical protein
MLAVSSEECRARAAECLRHAANKRMPLELRESWLGLAHTWEAWAAEAAPNLPFRSAGRHYGIVKNGEPRQAEWRATESVGRGITK